MPPNSDITGVTGVLTENDGEVIFSTSKDSQYVERSHNEVDPNWNSTDHIVWRNVVIFILLHASAIFGLYLTFTFQVKFLTIAFAALLYVMGGLGITAGAHRLWAHRSYKARLPLKIFLGICNTIAVQNHIYEWARDHRAHHKFSETDADPHNASRGFFFAHMGWLLARKHPDVKTKGKMLDLSDLEQDIVVHLQRKYYWYFVLLFSVIIPTLIPYYVWGETYLASYCVAVTLRYCHTLHMTWLVNSAAHMFGNRPYDKHINASENSGVSIGAFGEGWHNYHHTFPWDYKASELGFQGKFNLTSGLIDFWAKLGLAYDLKTVSREVIGKRVERTGDGSHPVWGFGDKDLNQEEVAVENSKSD